MPYNWNTNYKDDDNIDLGRKLVTKEYLFDIYPGLIDDYPQNNLGISPFVWAWGANEFGQCGINDSIDRLTPSTTLITGGEWKSIAGGGYHSAGIKLNGTLWTWGLNDFGQLGINESGGGPNFNNRSTPVTTLLGGTNWKSVKCGFKHTIATKTDGTLWLWGNNENGQLGVHNITSRSTPVTTLIGGNNWDQIQAAFSHNGAIKTDGTLWLWGRGDAGQMGLNTFTNAGRSTPVTTALGGTDWKTLSCGGFHNFAIKTDGSLYLWGFNEQWQLGTNTTTSRALPVQAIDNNNNWRMAVANGYFSAAIKADGTLWTWGGRIQASHPINYGNMGINDSNQGRATPVTTILGGTNWKSLVCGREFVAALKTDGTIWAWGRNDRGQLGLNDTTSRSTPVLITYNNTNWKQLSAGFYMMLGITTGDSPI